MNWIKRNLENLTNQKTHFIQSIFPIIILFAIGVWGFIITRNANLIINMMLLWFGITVGIEIEQYRRKIAYWFFNKIFDTVLDIIAGNILFWIFFVLLFMIR